MSYYNDDNGQDPSAEVPSGGDYSELDNPFQPFEPASSYLALKNIMPDAVFTTDKNGTIMTVNRGIEAYGYKDTELKGTLITDLIHPDDRQRIANSLFEGVAECKDHVRTQQFRVLTKSKQVLWVESNSIVRFTPGGDFISWEGVWRDITGNLQAQNTLLQIQETLEEQVRLRTAELMQANVELQKEIQERRDKERQLMEREEDLEMEKINLQETNTALRVLLKQRDADKQDFEAQVMYNVKELVLPYLDRLRATALNEHQEAYLSILEANLSDVTSSFIRRLALDFYGLTTSELKVANFIRQGKKNREIASLLGLSTRTIETFRQSIRRKLRINNKKVNLRTLLISIQ